MALVEGVEKVLLAVEVAELLRWDKILLQILSVEMVETELRRLFQVLP